MTVSQSPDPGVARHERALLLAAQHHDPHAETELVRRYEPLIQAACARHRRPAGYDRHDLAQEARIGLWHAIRAWRPDRGAFPAFARVCVAHQVINALDSAGARKHQLLSQADPLPCTDVTGAGQATVGVAPPPVTGRGDDPLEVVIARERLGQLIGALPTLNARERTVLAGSLNDRSERQLAREHACTAQAIHGVLGRARVKLAVRATASQRRPTLRV